MAFRQQHKPTREEREKNRENQELRAEYGKLRKEVKRLRKQLRKEFEREPVEPQAEEAHVPVSAKTCPHCGGSDLKDAPTWQAGVVLVVCTNCDQRWKETSK